jgi:hypothetical protein
LQKEVNALETCLTKLNIGPYCENNKEVGVVFKALQSIERKFDASQVEHKVVVKKICIIEEAAKKAMERHKVCL